MTRWLWLPLLALTACTEPVDDDTPTPGGDTQTPASQTCDTTNEQCAPGVCSTGEGSPEMLPGANCMNCHVAGKLEDKTGSGWTKRGPLEDDELFFTIAGTAFADRYGSGAASGATVRVTDSQGKVVTLTSNAAGNFYSTEPVVPPLTAEIERNGQVRSMGSQATTGACNSCHYCEGPPGGKLYAP